MAAGGDETLPRRIIADPRAIEGPLARVAVVATERPWELRRADAGDLDDARLLQVVLLAGFFAHVNRMADAIAIELDYDVAIVTPHADEGVASWPRAPRVVEGAPALDLGALRPAAAELLGAWERHALEREEPLSRRQRQVISAAAGACLGRGPAPRPSDDVERALAAMAESLTLTPWRSPVPDLRPILSDDAMIFDAVATASSAATFARIAVALSALGAS